jgi:hypothetical protein
MESGSCRTQCVVRESDKAAPSRQRDRLVITNQHRTNGATKAVVAGFISMTLVACGGSGRSTTIVRMPATELPGLGPSTLQGGPPPPAVKTIDGSAHQIAGPIDSVEIKLKDKIVPVGLPFKARIQNDQLEVLTDQVRTYPTSDISFVQVYYGGVALAQKRDGRSAGLIAAGIITGGLGGALIYADSGCTGGGFVDLCGFGTILGIGLALTGAGLLIGGFSVSATPGPDPRPQAPKTTTIQPKLRLSPTGGTLSFEF